MGMCFLCLQVWSEFRCQPEHTYIHIYIYTQYIALHLQPFYWTCLACLCSNAQASGSLVVKDFGTDEEVHLDNVDVGDRAAELGSCMFHCHEPTNDM